MPAVSFEKEDAWTIRQLWAGKAKRGGKMRFPVIYRKIIALASIQPFLPRPEEFRPEKPPTPIAPPIVLTKTTKGLLVLIDGRHRITAWRKKGFTHTEAWILDYTGDPKVPVN